MIYHLVFFKLQEDQKHRKEEVIAALRDLKEKIPQLQDLTAGEDFNRSPAAFDIGLQTLFATTEDLATYQKHPDHLKVVELINETTSERAVVDYKI